ncbi:MAG: FAD-dependent monooxygenase, partial [Anaerolineae bacterium]|nr:FAD-dependent monooxygenase [Anaerolineae bacterium]
LPRRKTCAGILVPELYAKLRSLGAPGKVFAQPARAFARAHDWVNGLIVPTPYWFGNADRHALDAWLLERLPDEIDVAERTHFRGFEEQDGELTVYLSHGGESHTVRARYLIGADGAAGNVRLQLGALMPPQYLCVQEFLRADLVPRHLEGIVDERLTPAYIWVFPKAEDVVLLGAAFPPGTRDARARFEHIKALIQERLGFHGELLRREGGQIIIPRTSRDLYFGEGDVLLARETTGLVSAHTGDGISYAVLTGELAARAIDEDHEAPLPRYRELVRDQVQRARRAMWLARVLHRPGVRRGLQWLGGIARAVSLVSPPASLTEEDG